jgi:hypothetical protein
MTVLELVTIQLLLGGPVYLLAVVMECIGLLRWRHYSFRYWKFWGILGLSLSVAVGLSVAIWAFWRFHFDIMFLEAVNLPALAAAMIVVPIVLAVKKSEQNHG